MMHDKRLVLSIYISSLLTAGLLSARRASCESDVRSLPIQFVWWSIASGYLYLLVSFFQRTGFILLDFQVLAIDD